MESAYSMLFVPNVHLPINLLPYYKEILLSYRNTIGFTCEEKVFLVSGDTFFINFSEISNLADIPMNFPKDGVLTLKVNSPYNISVSFNKEQIPLKTRTSIVSKECNFKLKIKSKYSFYPLTDDSISLGYYANILNSLSSKELISFNKYASFNRDCFCIGGHPTFESLLESGIDPEVQFSHNPYVNLVRAPLVHNNIRLIVNVLVRENDLELLDFKSLTFHLQLLN